MIHSDIRPARKCRPGVLFPRVVCSAFLIIAGGCYGYYPAAGAQPSGRDVQLTLTDSGAVVLASQIGPSAEAISGHVENDSETRFVLAVSDVRQRDGNEISWKGERLIVPRPLIAKIEERRFSRARTGLFGGAITVALVALRQAFGGSGGSTPGSGLVGGTGGK